MLQPFGQYVLFAAHSCYKLIYFHLLVEFAFVFEVLFLFPSPDTMFSINLKHY